MRTRRRWPLTPASPPMQDWRATLGDARFASIVDRAIAAQPAQAWEIALMAGDEARAREFAADRPDPW